ncbi:MAG: response regulator transcription factor [Campylobacterales bacterium]|nr:response regulator transcription factor [Campylobacterales bacterium]HEO98945.1 response regulator transcription factor [Campylobacterota bacterium]
MVDYGRYCTIFPRTKDLAVLLVEDYEPLRNDMAELFEDLFKSVTVASDGAEALKLYQSYLAQYKKSYDLLITDIQMPFMNGVELSKSVREINRAQKIIVLSAHTDADFLVPLINLGISQFLTKPIKSDELIDILDDVSKNIIEEGHQVSDVTMLQLGEGFVWDSEKNMLFKDDLAVELTKYELILLKLFMEKAELICIAEDILYCFDAHQIEMSEKNIRNLVSKLRKKLPENLISNLYGMGYKLTFKT